MYPIKFQPIIKEKIWGGQRLAPLFDKNQEGVPNIGESWEISAVPGDFSVASNGALAGKTLPEIIDIYQEKILGTKVFAKTGKEFPLLFKLIDADQDLSIQVHPNDEVAGKRHNSLGKTEMWYVLNAEENAYLIIGFEKDTVQAAYLDSLEKGKVEELLQKVYVQPGDVFFIPAGLVHAIGSGVTLAEIQESSDITYRIFDFNRKDDQGNLRDLHTEEALDVIDFSASENPKTVYSEQLNGDVNIVHCEYFHTNIVLVDQLMEMHSNGETFTVYMCLDGAVEIAGGSEAVKLKKGESVLIPAALSNYTLVPTATTRLLKVTIE